MIIIDPYMLAIPHGDGVNADVVRDYIQRLKKWEGQLSNPQRYVVLGHAMNEIHRLGLQPDFSNLKTLLERYEIDEYSAEDIVPTASGVLANGRWLEEAAGVLDSDLLYRIEHVTGTKVVIPDEIRMRMPETVAEAFTDSLIDCSYCSEELGRDSAWSIATVPLETENANREMLLRCVIEYLTECSEVARKELTHSWPLLFDPEHLYATYNIVDYYVDDPWTATFITWCKLKSQGKPVVGLDLSSFEFGERFISSLHTGRIRRRPSFTQDVEKVFEAVVQVLEDLWPYGGDKHHDLRTHILARSSPQQTRAREIAPGVEVVEKAARVHVTTGANCLRLHYWQCHDGTYEFANVTDDHNDATIY